MTDLNDAVLDEAEHRGKYLLPRELLTMVEYHHGEGTPGVDREHFVAYTEALDERTDAIDHETFESTLDDQLTDEESWVDEEAVYELPSGRISAYPARFHETLAGSNDPRAYLRFLQADSSFEPNTTGTTTGVPEGQLVDVMSVVGHVTPDEAKAAIERLREEGEVVEDADQHPDANVYLDEQTEYDREEMVDKE
ncbi:hypothetical protein [Halomarina ordinaria]|uniref:Uncharacterized protein n=1 Tax=Halomarina ordinaria TaxID=3033939 RepID=A0ABD5UBR8_9EURY|nr:hypothetical protein [Halomarina sp. PSRA2]